MPKFHIERSIEISASSATVRDVIQDYGQWEIWSPWLIMEPDAKLEFQGSAATIGHSYEWTGDMVGAGRMELSAMEGDTDKMDLTFLKPFKSTAKVAFQTIALSDTQTRVTWHMDSGLPFFMFFMVNTMKAMIGMDYERGLKMLKEYIETDQVSSSIDIAGVVDVPETHYIGASADSNLADISTSMETTFVKVAELAKGKTIANLAGSIYHSMDIKSQHCKYTAFLPVAESDATGSIGSCRALKVTHTGSYQHLGNAWSTANTYQRHNKLKKNKQIAPFELYLNDPATTPAKDLQTEIFLPVNA